MFDSYTVREEPNYPQTVTKNVSITEKRAPTDKSVELLGEMQEKALNTILGKVKLESNILKNVVVNAVQAAGGFTIKFIYEFKINDEYITGTLSFDSFDFYDASLEDIFNALRDKILEELTHRIMLSACSDPYSKKSINTILDLKNKM